MLPAFTRDEMQHGGNGLTMALTVEQMLFCVDTFRAELMWGQSLNGSTFYRLICHDAIPSSNSPMVRKPCSIVVFFLLIICWFVYTKFSFLCTNVWQYQKFFLYTTSSAPSPKYRSMHENFRFMHLPSLFVCMNLPSNMATWFQLRHCMHAPRVLTTPIVSGEALNFTHSLPLDMVDVQKLSSCVARLLMLMP